MSHITLTNFAKTYGPLVSLRLGTQYLVVGSSPSAAIEILKTHDRILSDLDKISIGWASQCNNGWKYLRTLCRTGLFSSQVLESQACLREKKVMELVEFLRSKEGQVVFEELAFATMSNMLSNVVMPKDIANLEKETEDGGMRNLVRGLVEAVSAPNIFDFYPILGKFDLQGLRKKTIYVMTKIRSNWESILEERRNSKRSGSSSQQNFLDTLLDNGVTNDCIHQIFVELLSAGSDTSTSTTDWTMAELIKNVESMKKVQDELEIELSGNDYPKESQLLQMSYVASSSMIAASTSCYETCHVMSYTVPKDAQILVNIWAIARDPFIWEEPEMLRPQILTLLCRKENMPRPAMAAIKIPLILASLVHFFDWELPHGKCPAQLDMTEKFGVTRQKKEPLILIPRARK
ncbi:unnamed protein product [Withania somnifera]